MSKNLINARVRIKKLTKRMQKFVESIVTKRIKNLQIIIEFDGIDSHLITIYSPKKRYLLHQFKVMKVSVICNSINTYYRNSGNVTTVLCLSDSTKKSVGITIKYHTEKTLKVTVQVKDLEKSKDFIFSGVELFSIENWISKDYLSFDGNNIILQNNYKPLILSARA